MTFDEWWIKTATEMEMPKGTSFYPCLKMLAESAWEAGSKEGARELLYRIEKLEKEGNVGV